MGQHRPTAAGEDRNRIAPSAALMSGIQRRPTAPGEDRNRDEDAVLNASARRQRRPTAAGEDCNDETVGLPRITG